jgi:hypothetical protein
LTNLFQLPPSESQAFAAYGEVGFEVQLGFEPSAAVCVGRVPTNTATFGVALRSAIAIDYRGPSSWLTIETNVGWADLGTASTFHVGMRSTQDRRVRCTAVLRGYQAGGAFIDHPFAVADVSSGEGHVSHFGPLELPVSLGHDAVESLRLLLFLDAREPLEMRIEFLTISFT